MGAGLQLVFKSPDVIQDRERMLEMLTSLARPLFALCAVLLAVSCSAGIPQPPQPWLVPAPGSPLAVPFAPGGVALGDMDNDGKLDLVVRSSENPSVAIFLGSGDGQFQPSPASPIQPQAHASEIALGDVNRDGWLDLALGSHDSYQIELLLADGAGGFIPAPVPYITMKTGQKPHTHGLALGDLNNDGSLDLVAGNTSDGDVAVALGDGLGGFDPAAGSPFAVAQGPYPLALADLDSDGNLDIAVTSTLNQNARSGDSLTVLFGDGQGGFERSQVPVRTPDPWFVAVGDVNGDGKPDLLSTHWESAELTVLVGDGSRGFTEVSGSPFDLGHATWYIGVADFDGDGNADVAAAADGSVRLMLGDGGGGLMPAPDSPYPTAGGSWRLAIGDLNGDGKPDIAASNLTASSVTVLLAR